MVTTVWEKRFRSWKKPLSKTEVSRFKRVLQLILDALHDSLALQGYDFKVRVFGSYRNRTNLRTLSDIDVYVACKAPRAKSRFWRRLAQGTVYRWVAPPWYSRFKKEVQSALEVTFGSHAVDRRNKAIGIRKTAERAGADVLVCVERRSGIEFWPDRGKRIVSWPELHRRRAASWNQEVRRYKAMVRLLKGLRHLLIRKGVRGPDRVSSFMIECLVWNVPRNYYAADDYMSNLRGILSYLRSGLHSLRHWPRWWQVNEKERLTSLLRKRREDVCRFIDAAWEELGFEPVEG